MIKTIIARLFSPLPLREGMGVVLLLLMGSASLQAQGGDPFGEVDIYKYSGSMTITSQVIMNGNVVTNAVVAVYCENELREKKSVGSGTNPNLVFLTVHGDYTGGYQFLYFKVYTDGHIFTYHPDPAIDFEAYYPDAIGTASNPYIIDITPVSLANDADNTTTLTTYKDETCDIALTGRTLYKDGNWNTLCLPFTLTASEVSEHLKNPIGLMTLSSSSFDSTKGTLTLNFSNELENGIVAGKPYIVKWNKPDGYTVDGGFDITDPVFTSVTISDATANVSTDYVDFLGTYGYMGFNADDRSILFLGTKNTLYYPQSGASIGACRGYFQLKGLNAGDIQHDVKMYFGEEEATGISLTPNPSPEGEGRTAAWFDLNGRRLNDKPTSKGLYIYNGRKVVIN